MSADGGVISSNLCCNENKPPQWAMVSEEHVIFLYFLSSLLTCSLLSVRTQSYWRPTGDWFFFFFITELRLSLITPVMQYSHTQPWFQTTTHLHISASERQRSGTPTQPSEAQKQRHTNAHTHRHTRTRVWTTSQQLWAAVLSITSSLTHVHFYVIIV